MCSSHSQIQQYLYEQSYNFEEVQLQRIKLELGAFRFQTVPLKAEKHRPLAFAVTCGPPRSTGPLVTASPAPHQSYPTRTAPANRTELRAQDVLGHAQQKAAVQSSSCWTLATQQSHTESPAPWGPQREPRSLGGSVSCPNDHLRSYRAWLLPPKVRKQAAWGTQWCWVRQHGAWYRSGSCK